MTPSKETPEASEVGKTFVENCIHNYEFVRTETILPANNTTGSYRNVDLVICHKCGNTKRI